MKRISILIPVAVAVFLVTASIENVGPYEVALVGSEDNVRELGPGIHLVVPFRDVVRFKLRQTHRWHERDALEVRLPSGEEAEIEMDLETALARDKIRDLYRNYGDGFFEKVLKPVLRVELATALSEGSGRSEADLERLASGVTERVNAKIQPLGAQVISLAVTGVVEDRTRGHDLTRGEGVKLFILGLDGYDWIIMQRVAESVDLANMRELRRKGAWGDLESIEPLVSPLIWTTMVTGVTPDVHGITDFLVHDETSGEDIPVTSSMRRVPAVWNMTSLFDLTCGFIGWFASFPAERIDGFIVSDRFGYHMFDPGWKKGKRKPSSGLTYPADLYDEIEPLTVESGDVDAEMSRYIRGSIEPYRDESTGAVAPASHGPPDPETSLRQVISAYRTYERVMKKLYPTHRPDLFGIYFEFTDSICHLFMKSMKPAMAGVSPEEAERYGSAIAATYAEADRLLGDVLEMLDEDTVLMVVSDHGFKSGDFRPLSDSRMGFGQAIEWHRIKGSIAMYGSIVKPGYEITGATVMDIAPTILYLLGLPVDRKMDGKVLLDAFEDDWVANHPITYTSRYDSLIAAPDAAVGPGPGSQALKDKLVSLGYVAGGQSSLSNLASFYHKSGKYTEALEVYKQILEEEPDNIDAKIGMSNVYLKIGKQDMGVRMLNEILEQDPGNLEALHSLGNFYVETGDGRSALEVADRALRLDPENGESHFIRGIGLQKLGRDQEAAVAFRKALKLAPDMPEVYANLAMIYVNSGRPQEAVELVDKAVELSPGRPEILYIKGSALAAAGRNREALETFSEVMKVDNTYVPGYLGAARVLLAQGEYDSVLAICERAEAIESGYAAYVYDIKANAYLKLDRHQAAIAACEAAIEADPSLPGPRLNLAKILAYQGRKDDAERVLRELLARNPDHPQARQLLQSLRSN